MIFSSYLISGSVYELFKNPSLRAWLEQDWSRLPLALEEFLRFVSPVQFSKPRFVRHDIELDGVRVKKGEKIMAMLVAANMAPQANENPERLDVQRRPNHHISFGTGIHFCLGHQLARIEGMCALQALFTRWPNLRLAVEPSQMAVSDWQATVTAGHPADGCLGTKDARCCGGCGTSFATSHTKPCLRATTPIQAARCTGATGWHTMRRRDQPPSGDVRSGTPLSLDGPIRRVRAGRRPLAVDASREVLGLQLPIGAAIGRAFAAPTE